MTPLELSPAHGDARAPAPGARAAARGAALVGAGALAGLLLAGCGGDVTDPATPPNANATQYVPASAAASDQSLEAFAIGLAPSDTTEPLSLDKVPTFPSSETEEPINID